MTINFYIIITVWKRLIKTLFRDWDILIILWTSEFFQMMLIIFVKGVKQSYNVWSSISVSALHTARCNIYHVHIVKEFLESPKRSFQNFHEKFVKIL